MRAYRTIVASLLVLGALLSQVGLGVARAGQPASSGTVVLGWTPGVTRGVSPHAPIAVYFNRPMDGASLIAAWSLSPATSGTLHRAASSITFTPTHGLRPSTTYRVTLSSAARASTGGALQPFSATFSTGEALHVAHVSPAGGTGGVPIDSTISVAFNHPMVALSGVDAESVAPHGWSATIRPSLAGHGSWLGTSTWVFHPTGTLMPSTRYTVTVGGAAHDAWGDALGKPLTWSFHTIGPELYSHTPRNESRYVSPTTAVRVTFSQPMSHAVGNRFSVTSGGSPVPGRLVWSGATLTFHPTTPFTAGATYHVHVAGSMRSANDSATLGTSSTWSFQVAPLPRQTFSSPGRGKTAWAAALSPYYGQSVIFGPYHVTIGFNTPMNKSSLDTHLHIQPAVDNFSTVGEWNGHGQYRYIIEGTFNPSTFYTVTLDNGVTDAFGRLLSGPVAYPFTTSERFPSVALYGRSGGNSIAFSAGQVVKAPMQVINIPKVRFRLKHVTLSAVNHPPCGGCEPEGTVVRQWSAEVPTALDRVQNPDVTIHTRSGAPLPAGLYWLQAAPQGAVPHWNPPPNTSGQPSASSELVVVNNVSLTVKSTRNATLVWATGTQTGKPITGLHVRLADSYGSPIVTAGTGAGGIHIFAGYSEYSRPSVTAAVVNDGTHFGLTEIGWSPDQQSPTYLQFPSWIVPYNSSNGSYMYTDRAIYRAGQSVHVRALLWKDSDAVYSLLGRRSVVLTVTSSRGKQFVHRTVTLDRFGAVSASFTLPANLPTGDTQIYLGLLRGESVGTSITVAEYRKPEFLTTVTPSQPRYAQGATAAVHVKVKYVFGTPVAGQHVAWTAYSQPLEQQPPGWDGYTFITWEDLWSRWDSFNWSPYGNGSTFGVALTHGKGTTDAAGDLTIHLPVSLKKDILDRTVTLEVTATDENSQSVSGRATLQEFHSNLAIGVAPRSAAVTAGAPVSVDVAAVHQDGTPAPNTALTATIAKRTYTSKLVSGRNNQTYWQPVPHDIPVSTQTLTSGQDGKTTLTFTPAAGGEYYITVAGTDAAGNSTKTSLSIDVTSDATVNWGADQSTNIVLKPDRADYAVGQTAHIAVPAPFAGASALVTVERGTIRRSWVTTIKGTAGIVDVPIALTDVPNEYITVTLYHGWRGSLAPEWRTGTAEIHVKLDPRHVQVHIAQSGAKHHPGDTVTYTVKTTVNGKPISTQLSLALVDTAILALKDEPNPNILQSLYADRSLDVTTSSQGAISIDNLTARANSPVVGASTEHPPVPGVPLAGGGGGGGFPGTVYASAPAHAAAQDAQRTAGAKITIRSNFQDTAFWRGTVVTSAAGTATVRVHLPDNTTTWQLDARGITTSQAVGQGTVDTLATRDLVLRPVLPRFFVQGDHLRVGVALDNNLTRSVTTRVTLSASGLSLAASPETVTLPAHGEHLLLFSATVPTSSVAVLTARAIPTTAGVQGDAVQLPVPVHAPLTDETTATAGQVYSSTRQMVIVPRNAVTSPGALTLSVQSSLTAGLGTAYSSLKPTEWESNDDVASRLLAASALHGMRQSITGLHVKQYNHLSTAMTAAVQKLLDTQFYDGGWPWFTSVDTIESDPLVTADAVQALVASGRHDRQVRQSLSRARGYLSGQLHNANGPLTARLLAVLARSGDYPHGKAESLYNNSMARLHLDAGALADLGDALGRSGDTTKAHAVVGALEAGVKVSATGAHWESSNTSFFSGPPVLNTTEALNALLHYAPHDPLVPATARWLMLARQADGWDCNRDTAQAIATLAAFAHAAGEGTADYTYRVRIAQSSPSAALQGRYTPTAQSAVGQAKVRLSQLPHGAAAPIDIARTASDGSYGTGPLYYLARLHYYLPANDIAPLDEGVSVSRRFLSLTGKQISSIRAGSAMKVQLTIHTTQSLLDLDIKDPLPSGCEPIDASLNTAQRALGAQPFYYPWQRVNGVQDLTWYLVHSDLRDNQVDLYAQYLPPGTYRYTYLTQATVAGTYAVPPTHAAEHFFPEVFGRSHGQVLTVD
jgi:uncharacterized protein YfaS (alpha-2-macroglobulin family)